MSGLFDPLPGEAPPATNAATAPPAAPTTTGFAPIPPGGTLFDPIPGEAQPPPNEPSIAAQAANIQQQPPPAQPINSLPSFLDAYAGPGWRTGWGNPVLQDLGIREATPEEKEATRIALRFFPPLAVANFATVGSQLAMNALRDKMGLSTHAVFNPTESAINALGMQAPPDQSEGSKTFEELAPFVIPTPATIGRVGEAAGLVTKGLTLARATGEGALDWLGSDAAQQYAQAHGWGPLATALAGMVGSQAHSIPGHVISIAGKIKGAPVLGNEDAGDFYDASRKLGFTPPAEDVLSEGLRPIASGLTANPLSGTGTLAAQAAQKKAIIDAWDTGNRAIDPNAPSVADANAGTLTRYAEDLSTRARDQIVAQRQAAAAESDRLEGPIMDAQTDPAPIQQALEDIITDPENRGSLKAKSAQALLDDLNNRLHPITGGISFSNLKEARSQIGATIDRAFPVQTGVPTTSREVGEAISPVKDAMTAGMQNIADNAGVGPEWAANDAKWRQASADLQNLQGVAGTLQDAGGKYDPNTGQTTQPDWNSTPDATSLANRLRKAVGGNMPVIETLNRGMPGEGASALSQVLAAMGKPEQGGSSGAFRPDLLATDYRGKPGVGDQAKMAIAAQAGPEALGKLEDAANAAASTARPRKPEGLSRALGGLAWGAHLLHGPALPIIGGVLGGPVGAAAGLAARPLSVNFLNDPAFVRLVAGRRLTQDNIGDVLAQYAQRAGLGATQQPTPILPALKAAWSSIPLPSWSQTGAALSSILGSAAGGSK